MKVDENMRRIYESSSARVTNGRPLVYVVSLPLCHVCLHGFYGFWHPHSHVAVASTLLG